MQNNNISKIIPYWSWRGQHFAGRSSVS